MNGKDSGSDGLFTLTYVNDPVQKIGFHFVGHKYFYSPYGSANKY